MKIQYLLILLYAALLSISKNINALEYQANHDQTYWFYDDENSHSGMHLTRVRSNVAWGESINILTIEEKCDEPLSSIVLHSDILGSMIMKNNIDIKSWEGKEFIFKARVDNSEEFEVKTNIWFGAFNDDGKAIIHLILDAIPDKFIQLHENQVGFNKVLELTIPKSNHYYKYFEVHKRKYRMEGLVPSWIQAHSLCMDNSKNA